MLNIALTCARNFLNHSVNPRALSMANQTLNEQGEPIDVIPSTSDVNPGYHTGLSVMDFLCAWNECKDRPE